jgi:DNA-binding Lrp family transcriptional regulator
MEFKELINKINSSSIRKASKELNIPLARLYRFLNKLEKDGYIVKVKKGQLVNYTISREDETVSKLMKNLLYLRPCSLSPRSHDKSIVLRIHNLVAKVPIISGSENIMPEKVIKLNNVERKYFKIENLASAEIINKTLIIYLPEIKASPSDLELILTTYFRILNHIFIYLQSKYRLFCDLSQLQIVRQHISYEGDLPNFPLTAIKTNKEAKSIAEYKEKAWVKLG